jgi:hypothetical protein
MSYAYATDFILSPGIMAEESNESKPTFRRDITIMFEVEDKAKKEASIKQAARTNLIIQDFKILFFRDHGG